MKIKNIYITEKELAERWSLSNFTLQRWRLDGKSLPYFKIGKSIRYSLEVIEAFEAQNISTATEKTEKAIEIVIDEKVVERVNIGEKATAAKPIGGKKDKSMSASAKLAREKHEAILREKEKREMEKRERAAGVNLNGEENVDKLKSSTENNNRLGIVLASP